MLTLAVVLAFGQIAFDEQPLPDVHIGAVTPFTGRASTNFLLADLDGDGALDLVLPGYVSVQEKGLFPEAKRAPLPPCDGNVEADLFGGALYYRTPAGLSIYAWADGQWRLELEQPLDWPGEEISFSPMGARGAAPVFRRFTYDLDEDGIPELVGLDAEGCHLYRRGTERFEPAGMLDVFPTTVVNRSGPQAIWPPGKRQVILPEQRMSCRLLFAGRALTVITDLDGAEGKVRFRRDNISVDMNAEGQFAISATQTTTSDELPAHVRPCHLNGDDTVDYGGTHWTLSDVAPVPMPLHETWASLDGGKTFQIERATTFHNFRPYTSFVDFDSDGDQDMVVESTSFFDSGLRESVNQYLSRRTIPHTIRIFPQSERQFSDPLVCDVEFELEAPPVSPGPMLARYQAGELANVTGDFNGDGFLDLALRRNPAQLEIHLARAWEAFESRSAATLALHDDAEVSVADINGDGLADVLVHWEEVGDAGNATHNIAHLARKAAP